MFKHIASRIAGTVATVTALVVLTTSNALAVVDPGLGEGSGSAAPPPPLPTPLPFEVFGMAWQSALALAVALIAVVGLVISVQARRHIAGQHA
jgi:low affinity Fe/Cu permease